MHYIIYKITNRLNGKIYIGKHQTNDDMDDYLGSGTLLKRAMEKYGHEHFEKEILCRCRTETEMNEMEAKIVDEDFVARDDTYNIMLGGCGGWDYIRQNKLFLTDKFYLACDKNWEIGRQRLSQLRLDPKFRATMDEKSHLGILKLYADGYTHPWAGRKHTSETIEKMRTAKIGKYDGNKNPMFGKMWINDGTSSTRINKTDPIPHGYKKGRLPKMSS